VIRCPHHGGFSAWRFKTEDTTSQDDLSHQAAKNEVARLSELARIGKEVQEAIDLAEEDGETPISDEAKRTCLKLARFVLPKVVSHKRVKTAAFDEGEGRAALVIHSLEKRRRLSLEISADGSCFEERRTDEHLRTETRSIRSDYVQVIVGSIHWLIGEAG
jgi:hypothetical protein